MVPIYARKSERVIKSKRKLSPFLYFDDMTYTITQKKGILKAKFRKEKKTGAFPAIYSDILFILQKYQYLNAYLLREAVLQKNFYSCDTIAFRKILKKMVSKGYLIQYEFHHKGEDGTVHGSPFIYTLSEAGERCVIYEGGTPIEIKKDFDLITVLNHLAFNQYYILFQKQFQTNKNIIIQEYYGSICKKSKVQGYMKIKISQQASIQLFVFSIRQSKDWNQQYLGHLRAIVSYLNKNTCSCPLVLTICETEQQAMKAEKYRSCCKELNELETYFVCDSSLLESETVFHRLIEVLPRNNFTTRKVIRLLIE